MSRVFLRRKIAPRVQNGHPWIFMNEVDRVEGSPAPADIVEVFSHDSKWIGSGYYNPQSQIVIRILSREKGQEINADFFKDKIRSCWQYRQQTGYTENCRLVFGEADGLPQLIIDKFNDYFVIQTLALGIDRWKPVIVEALLEIFSPKGIYERNDVPVRELEGLPQQKGFLTAPFETKIIIKENGLQFYVDLANGQKTGYFLDQQDNRTAIRSIVKNADVLGAFTYTGTFEVANAFDLLKQWAKEGKQYDVVMLDPPAFTKSRATIQKAITGYKEINLRGMKLVKPGGFLVTSSCTNLVPAELFLEIIGMAAKDARRKIRQVCFQTQSADHPIVWEMENTQYLKFLIVQVL